MTFSDPLNRHPGKAWVRFELADIPWTLRGRPLPASQKRRQVVMRVLEFVSPPNPDDAVFQVEGELVKRVDQKNNLERPWICKSHTISPFSMKALVEAYPVSTTAKGDTAPPGERKVSNHNIYRQFLATERIRLDFNATTTLTHLVMAISKVDNHDNRFISGSFDIIDARAPSLLYLAELLKSV
jgi:hypothetical protein